MNNEEKILSILMTMQADISELKTDVAELKTDVAVLKTDVAKLKTDVTDLQQGQLRIEKKIDQLASIQNDDVVALVKNTNEIRQSVKSIQTDVFYLAEKTLDNSKQILRLAE